MASRHLRRPLGSWRGQEHFFTVGKYNVNHIYVCEILIGSSSKLPYVFYNVVHALYAINNIKLIHKNVCFHLEGNAGFRAHFPALFEPVPDANSEESEVEERRTEDKDDEHEAGTSVEVQIGRKLREMGDHFQREHLQLVRMTSDRFRFKCKHAIYEGKQGSQVL